MNYRRYEKMDGIAIKTDGLTKKFGDFTAVDHISFDVKKGEIFGFLGPNGAGKSTTIRMLCTLSRPTAGSATVAGFDVMKEDSSVREHIGLVSEKMIMYDRLTARENLRLFGQLYNLQKEELEKRIDELLAFVRMTEWGDHQIRTYSTGMKQRINVIRALLNHPEILFLDEPTLGLDPQSTNEIRELTRKINADEKTTIILTTHMMTEADMLCNRIGIIDKGKIVALDSPSNLKKMLAGTDKSTIDIEISNLTSDMISGLKAVPSVNSVQMEGDTRLKVMTTGSEAFDDVIDSIRKRSGKIVSVKNIEPTLEDVFLHITGHDVKDQTAVKPARSLGRHGPPGMRPKQRVR
jgi:ABC-2 type transport system ATP-binding protein